MNEERFWSLIDTGRAEAGHDIEGHFESLEAALSGCSHEELIDFERLLDHYMNQTYTWELWADDYIINGGCSDDGFEYFRVWLISQGKSAVKNALTDPESLAELIPDDSDWEAEFEELLYLAQNIYEQKTGNEMPRSSHLPHPKNPSGERWEAEDLPTRYPRLIEVVERGLG